MTSKARNRLIKEGIALGIAPIAVWQPATGGAGRLAPVGIAPTIG
jgi:hypothetical protein